jgi:H+/Cl- antiporter ClcA
MAERFMQNSYLRAGVCSALIVLLTALVGTADYNGGGVGIIEGIFHGEAVGYEAFLLKIVFTALTVAAGLKGGEVIPALFVGASFGAAAAGLLSLPVPFGAAMGMAALFCGVTNCPLAAILLGAEMFGAESVPFVAVAVALSFLTSGERSLYGGKKWPQRQLCGEEK